MGERLSTFTCLDASSPLYRALSTPPIYFCSSKAALLFSMVHGATLPVPEKSHSLLFGLVHSPPLVNVALLIPLLLHCFGCKEA